MDSQSNCSRAIKARWRPLAHKYHKTYVRKEDSALYSMQQCCGSMFHSRRRSLNSGDASFGFIQKALAASGILSCCHSFSLHSRRSYHSAHLQCSLRSSAIASILLSIHRDIHSPGICSLSTIYMHRLSLYPDTDPTSLLRLSAIFLLAPC